MDGEEGTRSGGHPGLPTTASEQRELSELFTL